MTTPPVSVLTSALSGVFAAPGDVGALRDAAARARCEWIEVDLASIADKHGLLRAFASALAFPSTFGDNWDALADCLQDLSWRSGGGVVLYLRNAAALAQSARRDWATGLEILGSSATYWKTRGRPFVVLVDGVAGLPQIAR